MARDDDGAGFEAATGIGVLDRAVMAALLRADAGVDGRTIKGHLLLAMLDGDGVPPRPAYEHIASSTRADVTWVPLYRKRGNLGTRVDPPAGPEYVEVGLSEIGDALVRQGGTPVLPVGFVNGNIHLDGGRPAFDPIRVLDAVSAAADSPRIPDYELAAIVGRPTFPCGCRVECDVDALHAGEAAVLTMSVHLDTDPSGTMLRMRGVPPTVDPHQLVIDLCARALPAPDHPGPRHPEPLPLADLIDRSFANQSNWYDLKPRRGTTLDELRDALRHEPGITDAVTARLPAPTATIIRHHAKGDPDDVVRTATRLRALLLEPVR